MSRTFAVPVMVTASPCFTVSVEKLTFQNATVFIRSQDSWAFSPCADAADAVKIVSATPRKSTNASRRLIARAPPLIAVAEGVREGLRPSS